MMRFAVLCTKHPGFKEEREWRVIYQPKFQQSERIEKEIVCLDGLPQTICKIPLIEVPDENFYGANLKNFLDRIIIGPSDHAYEIKRTLVELLEAASIENPDSKVLVSGIPLRTNNRKYRVPTHQMELLVKQPVKELDFDQWEGSFL